MPKTTILGGSCTSPEEVKERLVAAGFDLTKPITAGTTDNYRSMTYTQGEFCTWTRWVEQFDSGCGVRFPILSPEMKVCPFCGMPLKLKEF
jgi:hypothetical protein